MRRAIGLLAVPFLFACGDTPTQVPLDVQPQFATVIGSGATWYFEATITIAEDPTLLGKIVTGSIAFTITSDDVMPDDPCVAYRWVESVATFTLEGQEYSQSDSWGQALSYMTCKYGTPWVVVNAGEGTMITQLQLFNPADTEDFPLTPPPLYPDKDRWLSVWNPTNGQLFFHASLTKVYAGPQTKADCMKDGWVKYGFKNQGQCVRYIETGKDSR